MHTAARRQRPTALAAKGSSRRRQRRPSSVSGWRAKYSSTRQRATPRLSEEAVRGVRRRQRPHRLRRADPCAAAARRPPRPRGVGERRQRRLGPPARRLVDVDEARASASDRRRARPPRAPRERRAPTRRPRPTRARARRRRRRTPRRPPPSRGWRGVGGVMLVRAIARGEGAERRPLVWTRTRGAWWRRSPAASASPPPRRRPSSRGGSMRRDARGAWRRRRRSRRRRLRGRHSTRPPPRAHVRRRRSSRARRLFQCPRRSRRRVAAALPPWRHRRSASCRPSADRHRHRGSGRARRATRRRAERRTGSLEPRGVALAHAHLAA